MPALPAEAAWWFLPFVTPICLWVAWSDMAHMKIRNLAVAALTAVYLLIGPIALPFDVWAWNWVHLIVVLVVGFAITVVGGMGAGDAKFAAAAAPFFMLRDLSLAFYLLTAITLAALVTHRTARALPAVRRLAPGWESWARRDFPMGLALGGTLLAYLGLAALS
ncbi:MAG: prepilin peptidase [Tranquillimonas sp.]